MVSSTRSSTTDVYIVVLDPAGDYIRALLFDSQGRQREGYSARLPMRKDASIDCLDEMHRLVAAAGFCVGAIVGRAESEVTAEDRAYWKSFEGAKWFAPLDHNGAILLGSGCLNRSQFGLVFGDSSFLGAIVDQPIEAEGLACQNIDEKRWLVSAPVEAARAAYAALRKAIKGSIEEYFEKSTAEDPLLAPIDAAARTFQEIFGKLSQTVGKPNRIIVTGAPLLQSPALCRRIAAGLGAALTLSTEAEPAARGSALWALERIGAVADLSTLEASTGAVIDNIKPENVKLEATTTMNAEILERDILERAGRIRMLLMDVDGVLTNAKLYNVPGPDGKMWETKGFDAQDGIALQWLSWYGIETGVISGRVSPATEERARQVKMTHVYQGHIEKVPILEQICEKSGIPLDAIAYIGDDLTDVVVMRRVSLAIAPANARPEVKKAAHIVTTAVGGSGAVREVCELLLKAQGKWAEILKKYEIE